VPLASKKDPLLVPLAAGSRPGDSSEPKRRERLDRGRHRAGCPVRPDDIVEADRGLTIRPAAEWTAETIFDASWPRYEAHRQAAVLPSRGG